MTSVKLSWNESALKDLERQMKAQTALLERAINRIASQGEGKSVEDLASELSAVIRKAGVTPNAKTVRTLAEHISAGKSIADLLR